MAAVLVKMKTSLSVSHSTLNLHERGAKKVMRSGGRREVIVLMPVSLLGGGTGKHGEGGASTRLTTPSPNRNTSLTPLAAAEPSERLFARDSKDSQRTGVPRP